MKRVLITGITGYIGSNLARSLLPDYQVFGLVRQPINLEYSSNLSDRVQLLLFDGSYESMESSIRQVRPDLIFHLAACSAKENIAKDTVPLIASNITFGGYLLTAMAVTGTQALVYASTVWEHFNGKEYCPLNLYAAAKHAFSDLALYYTDAGLLRTVSLVLSDTYGPNDHRPKILNLIKEAAKNGEILELSDGQQDYDVVYIDDVVQAFRQAGKLLLQKSEWRNETFQVCSPAPLSLRETVGCMLAVNGLKLNAAWGKRPNAKREIRKAVRLYPTVPGWNAQVPLDEGLKRICGSEQNDIT